MTQQVEEFQTYSNLKPSPNLWHVHNKAYGQGSRSCRVCFNTHGLIRKYGLNMCRRCFRENAQMIGFKKV